MAFAPISEVRRKTKRYKFKAMARALAGMGIPFTPAADGEPLVRQEDLDGNPRPALTRDEAFPCEPFEAITARKRPYRGARDGPSCSGIYFLFAGDELAYVGKAKNIAKRMRWHCSAKNFAFDAYAFLAVPLDRLAEVEPHYIVTARPRHNVAFTVWRQ